MSEDIFVILYISQLRNSSDKNIQTKLMEITTFIQLSQIHEERQPPWHSTNHKPITSQYIKNPTWHIRPWNDS